jgi:CDP-diacylglycerol---serine O-phosphatidyltransferase
MIKPSPRRYRGLPVRSLAPNILTVLSICAGLTSIRFSLDSRWEAAVAAIVVAAILDSLDGRLARLLKGATKFGAELDSLADFLSFGVATTILLYLWELNAVKPGGWIIALTFCVCCALRLARFNTALEDPDRPAWTADYFTGIPTPAAAGLALLPLILSFGVHSEAFLSEYMIAANTALLSFLMISRVPTYSFKRLRVRREYVLPTLITVALTAAVLVNHPWAVVAVFWSLYVGSIPHAVYTYRKHVARTANDDAADSDDRTEEQDDREVT